MKAGLLSIAIENERKRGMADKVPVRLALSAKSRAAWAGIVRRVRRRTGLRQHQASAFAVWAILSQGWGRSALRWDRSALRKVGL